MEEQDFNLSIKKNSLRNWQFRHITVGSNENIPFQAIDLKSLFSHSHFLVGIYVNIVTGQTLSNRMMVWRQITSSCALLGARIHNENGCDIYF